MHRLTARLIALLALALPLLASASPAHATLVIGTAGVPVTQNFDALGTSLNLASLNGGAWRISEAINAADFSTADTVLTQVQTGTLTISSLRGSYNFRDGANTLDRAVGMHVGGGFTHNRSIMLQILNDTGQPLEELTVSWDFEKYRNGSKTLQITSFHGDTGNTWLPATGGDHTYLLGTDLLGFETPVSTSKSISLSGLNIAAGEHYYMRWHFSVVDGTSDSFIVGIDNFSITGHAATAIPEASALVALPLSGAVWTVLAALRRLR